MTSVIKVDNSGTIRQTNPDNLTWPDAPTEEWS